MSESVLEPVKSKNPAEDTRVCWELAIRRVTDAKREDEVTVPEELLNLGIDIAARAAVLSKHAAGDAKSKEVLAKLFATERIYSPFFVAARVNSLIAFYGMTDNKDKKLSIFTLDKALRGLQPDETAPIDYSVKSLYDQTVILLKAAFTLSGKYSEFEGNRLVIEDSRTIRLNGNIASLLKQNPDRHAAIVELIGNRRVGTKARVLEMLNVSQANSLMDGAL